MPGLKTTISPLRGKESCTAHIGHKKNILGGIRAWRSEGTGDPPHSQISGDLGGKMGSVARDRADTHDFRVDCTETSRACFAHKNIYGDQAAMEVILGSS